MPALSTDTMAWIVGICVAASLGCIVYAVTAPQKQHDPHRGVAVGCLMFAAIPGIVLAILLAIGVLGGFDGLVRVLFYLTGIPAAYLLVLLLAQPIIKRRQNRNAWESVPDDDPQAGPPRTDDPQAPEPTSGEST
jgi:hypothetical protein